MKTRFLPFILFSILYLTTTLTHGANNGSDLFQKDSIKERRDEYFKGVQIIIDDKPANVSINKPYEKLNDKEKEYYLYNVPEKEKASGINESDFTSFTKNETASYYLDNIKTSREEILKKPREYYACGGSKRSQSDERHYFYTYQYFEKHIKHIKDHYPEKEYKIIVLNEARKYLMPEQTAPPKKTYEREGHANDGDYVVTSFMSYGYTDDLDKQKSQVWGYFPGGKDKFSEYLFSNLKVPYDLKGQELRINFTINTDGSLSMIYMDKGTDPLLEEEVKRVMQNSPRWIPFQENGIPQPMGTRDQFKK